MPWPTISPEEARLDRRALEDLVLDCERTETEALLVLAGEHAVVARAFGHPVRPIQVMSVTKGFAGFAIGFLLAEGKLSLDDPLSTWFPDWKDGKKARVLLRHVLTHTSGLHHDQTSARLDHENDSLAYVRALEIDDEPGTVASYSNEATMLLSGVIAKAAGEQIDTYLQHRLFEPLGITDASWVRDDAGNVRTYYGLSLGPVSFAKVGLALCAERVVPPAWIKAMQKPSKLVRTVGLLTFIVEDGPFQIQDAQTRALLEKYGFGAQAKLAPLDGKRFRSSRPAYYMEAGALLTPEERVQFARTLRDGKLGLLPFKETPAVPVGYQWNGSLGQWLVVFPKSNVVAIRQRSRPVANGYDNDVIAKISGGNFARLVLSALP